MTKMVTTRLFLCSMFEFCCFSDIILSNESTQIDHLHQSGRDFSRDSLHDFCGDFTQDRNCWLQSQRLRTDLILDPFGASPSGTRRGLLRYRLSPLATIRGRLRLRMLAVLHAG
jgi:hypothetical protein